MLFIAPVMPLQLDVRAVFEDAGDFLDGRLVRARDAVQPVCVFLHLLPGAARLSLRTIERTGCEKFAEVAIALAILDEEGETVVFLRSRFVKLARRLELHFRANDGFDAHLLCRRVKTRCAIDAVGVDEGHGGDVVRGGVIGEVLGQGGTVQEGKGGGGAELGVGAGLECRMQNAECRIRHGAGSGPASASSRLEPIPVPERRSCRARGAIARSRTSCRYNRTIRHANTKARS